MRARERDVMTRTPHDIRIAETHLLPSSVQFSSVAHYPHLDQADGHVSYRRQDPPSRAPSSSSSKELVPIHPYVYTQHGEG